MTIYAIPDVHGHSDKLERAHELVAADRAREGVPDAPVVHLGDLCDRGPDTRGVLDKLLAGRSSGEPWLVLLGNHDRMFLNFVTAGRTGGRGLRRDASWLHPSLGGADTLRSYGVEASGRNVWDVQSDALRAVPKAHVDFLASLQLWHESGDLLFVHAGIRPGIPLRYQDEEDLVWIRDGFLEYTRPHPWLVVHGHTALPEPAHFGNRVDLDGGAAYGNPLAAAVFEGRDVWLLEKHGRKPLRPTFSFSG
jgi:serine/threonine protein phosphatase 1